MGSITTDLFWFRQRNYHNMHANVRVRRTMSGGVVGHPLEILVMSHSAQTPSPAT